MKRPGHKTALARKLGITPQALSVHLRNPAAPAVSNLRGWQIWLAANGRTGSMPDEIRKGVAAARQRLTIAQADRAERENRKKAGELIALESATVIIADIVNELLADTERVFCSELPPMLEKLRAAEIQKKCAEQHASMSERLRTKFDKWKENP